MARTKTLLDGVNEVLKRTGIIQGESEQFTSLTGNNRQSSVDVCVQVWNETVDEVFSKTKTPFPRETATRQIILANTIREYVLPDNLVIIRWPLLDTTNTQRIDKYPGGYERLRIDLSYQANPTGLPTLGALNTSNNKLSLDRIPTTVEAGRSYEILYDRDTVMTEETDLYPFNDIVFRNFVPAVAHKWREAKQKPFDAGERNRALSTAMRYLRQEEPIEQWTPKRGAGTGINRTDPLESR